MKLLSKEERVYFNAIYASLSGTERVPKIAEGFEIICKSKDFVKSLLMNHITKTPKLWGRIVGETISRFPKEYIFDSIYLTCLILEMIEDGTIKPAKIKRGKPLLQHLLYVGLALREHTTIKVRIG